MQIKTPTRWKLTFLCVSQTLESILARENSERGRQLTIFSRVNSSNIAIWKSALSDSCFRSGQLAMRWSVFPHRKHAWMEKHISILLIHSSICHFEHQWLNAPLCWCNNRLCTIQIQRIWHQDTEGNSRGRYKRWTRHMNIRIGGSGKLPSCSREPSSLKRRSNGKKFQE